jgi:hypothetical protein
VCRISTESTTFASHAAARAHEPFASEGGGTRIQPGSTFYQSPHRLSNENAGVWNHPTSFDQATGQLQSVDMSYGSLRSVCVESSGAFGNADTTSTAATPSGLGIKSRVSSTEKIGSVYNGDRGSASPSMPSAQFAGVEKPWELPPEEFLARWRRSRVSTLPSNASTIAGLGTPSRSVSQLQDISVPPTAETLRITASFQ